ncbi:MAG TPA: maleylpyruvate isomerase family mycothiol-dependent enzyme [Micromonosporaceae bacterium]|nr:maleylpyruvate isomerase family mycothiol-dependent enzyme [Micromonosporaceae bacterium]
MTADPLVLLTEVDRATQRVLQTAGSLDDAGMAAPSLLPGWTRAHVLTHLARQADSLVNLLTAARTGEDIPQYASAAARNADIEAGAGRPSAEVVADLRATAARLADAASAMPPEAWAAVVRTIRGPRVAAILPWGRLREVEVHHVDLVVGYGPANWSEAFSHRLLHEVASDFSGRADAPAMVLHPVETGHDLTVGGPDDAPTVSGPAHELAAWLTGRTRGESLRVSPDGPLPIPPVWT